MGRSWALRGGVIVLAVWQVAAAAFSQAGVLPGDDVGTISDRYDSWIDPAGYAFSIWGLIYVASLVFAAYQAAAARSDDSVLVAVRGPVALGFLLSGVWILLFQQELFFAAHVVLIALTAALAVAYARLSRQGRPRTRAERWAVATPIGLYLGWATVATVAGTSTTLLAVGVDALWLPASVWAPIVAAVAGVIAVWVTLAGPPEPGFPLAVAWALTAIAVEQGLLRVDLAVEPARGWVTAAAGLAAVAVLVALAVRDARWHRRHGGAVGP